MFQSLTQNLTKVFDKLKSRGALTSEQIEEAMRDIRVALIDADVSLPVIRSFISKVKDKALGQQVIKSVSPAQMIIKIINDEMIDLLSPKEGEEEINLNDIPPVNILIVGLQGSGKTTVSAKLAMKLKKKGKKILLVSLDTYRPAAQEQLEILAKSIDVDSLEIINNQMPFEITERAMQVAKLGGYDVVIYDSAGRLHIDDEMIEEVKTIKNSITPTETLLVVDSMIGQDSVNVASHFKDKLDITGVVLSRLDGDSRGGAALSIRYITEKPIKFLSTGEKVTDFEAFDAKKMTSRILDMGDVVSFVEKAAEVIDQQEAEKTAKKIQKGKFDLNDYISQIKNIQKLGGISSMVNMIPGISKFTNKIQGALEGNDILTKQEAIVSSMTKKERRNPDIINASRRKRIANGSGTQVQDVNKLLKQFKQISSMMKKASRMDPKSLMRSMGSFFG